MFFNVWRARPVWAGITFLALAGYAWGHGSAVSPESRVHRVYASNPENPNFQLAKNAIDRDGTQSYYTWTELSRNIPAAVTAGLPAGFDYSPWVPDGQLASGGRVAVGPSVPRTYAGLDQVSADWPTSPALAGENLAIDFDAHTPHEPSVWDVWLTTANWNPTQPLNWTQMEFLGRPSVTLTDMHYKFDVMIPRNRVGHHVLWIAWQRDDPVGEVFFSTSDLMIAAAEPLAGDFNADGRVDAADYTVWRNMAGTSQQYAKWKENFGTARMMTSAVPEPNAFISVLAVLLPLWRATRFAV
jgi:predicted carbohydrate-binding protein with CBM5 and CBM33 domain